MIPVAQLKDRDILKGKSEKPSIFNWNIIGNVYESFGNSHGSVNRYIFQTMILSIHFLSTFQAFVFKQNSSLTLPFINQNSFFFQRKTLILFSWYHSVMVWRLFWIVSFQRKCIKAETLRRWYCKITISILHVKAFSCKSWRGKRIQIAFAFCKTFCLTAQVFGLQTFLKITTKSWLTELQF